MFIRNIAYYHTTNIINAKVRMFATQLWRNDITHFYGMIEGSCPYLALVYSYFYSTGERHPLRMLVKKLVLLMMPLYENTACAMLALLYLHNGKQCPVLTYSRPSDVSLLSTDASTSSGEDSTRPVASASARMLLQMVSTRIASLWPEHWTMASLHSHRLYRSAYSSYNCWWNIKFNIGYFLYGQINSKIEYLLGLLKGCQHIGETTFRTSSWCQVIKTLLGTWHKLNSELTFLTSILV